MLDLFSFNTITCLLHQFAACRNQGVILVGIDAAGRKLQHHTANAMLILLINQKKTVFRYRHNTHPAAILDNIIVRNDGAIGNGDLLAAYFQIGCIKNLLKRERSPGLMLSHKKSLSTEQ